MTQRAAIGEVPLADTRPLLKSFGKAVSVATEIATDKAVNARRLRQGSFPRFDLTDGQMITFTFPAATSGTEQVPHGLGRVPTAVFIAEPNPGVACTAKNAQAITLTGAASNSVSLWVV